MISLSTTTVQKALTHLGYRPGSIDGAYGPNTDAALARWGNDFRTGYGYFPRTSSSPDGRQVEIDPNEAASLLSTAARAYDAARAAREPAPDLAPVARTVGSGAALAVLLGVGGAALWASGFLGGRVSRRRGGLRGFGDRKKRWEIRPLRTRGEANKLRRWWDANTPHYHFVERDYADQRRPRWKVVRQP